MASITIEVDDDVLDDVVRVEGETDSRGRLNLGSDFGDETVEVLVLESHQTSTKESQTAD
jgi:hypothetical protein